MTPDELVRASLDLEAQFLEALGEDAKAEAVRAREPAEPAPQPHPPFRVITTLGDATIFVDGAHAWDERRQLEAPGSSVATDHFGRILPHFPVFIAHPEESSTSGEP